MSESTLGAPAPVGETVAPVREVSEAPELELELEEDQEADAGMSAEELEEYEYEQGKKYKVPKPLKELAEMGKDYRYKTGVVSQDRKAVEAEKTRYTQLVKQAEEVIKASQPPKPDPAMLDRMSEKYDPDTYHLQRANWEGWAQKAYQAEQERVRLESEASTKAELERAERKSTTDRELIKAIPQWRDAAVRASDRVKLDTYLTKTLGVSQEELGELDHDHRLTVGMYKAMLYDAALEKARARKTDELPNPPAAAPVRKVGGGHGNNGGVPKGTEAYIKWRRAGGKM